MSQSLCQIAIVVSEDSKAPRIQEYRCLQNLEKGLKQMNLQNEMLSCWYHFAKWFSFQYSDH